MSGRQRFDFCLCRSARHTGAYTIAQASPEFYGRQMERCQLTRKAIYVVPLFSPSGVFVWVQIVGSKRGEERE